MEENWRHQSSDEPYVMQARLGVRVRVRVGQRSFRVKIFHVQPFSFTALLLLGLTYSLINVLVECHF